VEGWALPGPPGPLPMAGALATRGKICRAQDSLPQGSVQKSDQLLPAVRLPQAVGVVSVRLAAKTCQKICLGIPIPGVPLVPALMGRGTVKVSFDPGGLGGGMPEVHGLNPKVSV